MVDTADFEVFSNEPTELLPDERVVSTKKDVLGVGVVEAVVGADAGRYGDDRVRVRWEEDGRVYHAKRCQVQRYRARGDRCAVVLCERTDDFRALAAQLQRSDAALELGCSWGEGTWRLGRRCASVLGVDRSPEALADAAAKLPETLKGKVTFAPPTDLVATPLAEVVGNRRFDAVFLDLGGVGSPHLVASLLPEVLRVVGPRVVVVKSVEFARAVAALEDRSGTCDAVCARALAWHTARVARKAATKADLESQGRLVS